MPNWCRCRLSIEGPEVKVAELKEACVATVEEFPSYKPYPAIHSTLQVFTHKADGTDLCFNKLVPVPQEFLEKTYDEGGHKWEVQNWGCKWGASCAEHSVDTPGKIEFTFDTPWQPPLLWVDKVSELYPELHFIIGYDEPDMNIHGRAEWNEGSLVEAGWEGHALECLVESPNEGE